MDFLHFLGVLRRWWKGLLLGIAVGVAISVLFVHQELPMYQSSTRLFIDQVQAPGPVTLNDVQTSQQLTKTYSELLRSRPLLTQTIGQFNLPFTPENLDERLTITPVRDTQIIQVLVKDTDAERAAVTANGLAQVFVRYVQDFRSGKSQAALQQVDRDIDAVQAQITESSSRLNQLRINIDATSSTTLEIQRLQQVLSQYDQDLRDIRQRSADTSSRINDLRAAPAVATASSSELQRLQNELAQYDKDAQNIRTRYTDTSDQLDKLRGTPVIGSLAQGDAQRLQEQLTLYEDKYRRLIDTRQSIAIAQTQNGASIIVTNPAQVPIAPISSHAALKLPLAGSIGLLLALALALVIEYFDDRMHDPGEMRQHFGIIPLTVLSFRQRRRMSMFANATRNAMDSYEDGLRTLRTNLRFVTSDQPVAICITSALDREGKSTVAMNLALLEAEIEKRVILVDANLRCPTLHRHLGLSNDEGLSTFLSASQDGREPNLQDGPHGVKVLTSGPVPPDPCGLLASARMADLITMLGARADMIILDTAAILPVPDSLALQQLVDGTLLIVDMRRTGRKTLEELLSALDLARAKVVGAVLNKADSHALRQEYHQTKGRDGRRFFVDMRRTGRKTLEELLALRQRHHQTKGRDGRHFFLKRPPRAVVIPEQGDENSYGQPEDSILVSKSDGDEGQGRGLNRV